MIRLVRTSFVFVQDAHLTKMSIRITRRNVCVRWKWHFDVLTFAVHYQSLSPIVRRRLGFQILFPFYGGVLEYSIIHWWRWWWKEKASDSFLLLLLHSMNSKPTNRSRSKEKRTSGNAWYIYIISHFSCFSLTHFDKYRRATTMVSHWSFVTVFLMFVIFEISSLSSTSIHNQLVNTNVDFSRTPKTLHSLIENIIMETNVNEQKLILNQLREYLNRMCVVGYFGSTHAEACQRIVELLQQKTVNSNEEPHGIQKRFFCNGFIGCKNAGRWQSTEDKRHEYSSVHRKKTHWKMCIFLFFERSRK